MKIKHLKLATKTIGFIISLYFLVACSPKNNHENSDVFNVKLTKDKQALFDAMQAHGHHLINGKQISFKFRDKYYTGKFNAAGYVLTRSFESNSGQITDILTNQRFVRLLNNDTVRLTNEEQNKYSASVNGVWYFVLLPYKLNDAAVNTTFAGFDTLNNQTYTKVIVTFSKEGGGIDYQDNYCYWFNNQTHFIDFLAYNFTENNQKGIRFREAINRQKVGGIVFQDYKNFKTNVVETDLNMLLKKYGNKELDSVSVIVNENITVKNLP